MPASAKAAISLKKLKTVGLPLLHPYEISKGEGSTYFFATDNGLKYSAYFIEYSATIHKVYSFSFDKEEESVKVESFETFDVSKLDN